MGWRPSDLLMLLIVGPIAMAGAHAEEPTPDRDRAVHGSSGGSGAAQLAEGVAGRLLESSWRPVVGALIVARSLDEPGRPIPEIAILSDAGGHFVWPLRSGRYWLTAVVDGQEIAAIGAAVQPRQLTRLDIRTRQ